MMPRDGEARDAKAILGRLRRWKSASPHASGSAMWKKVVAPTALVSVIWAMVTYGTAHVLNQVDDSQTLLLNQNRKMIQSGGEMQENLWRLQAVLFAAEEHRGNDDKSLGKFRLEARELEDGFIAALASASENASTAEERALVATIGENFKEYRTAVDEQLVRAPPLSGELRGLGPAGNAYGQEHREALRGDIRPGAAADQ